MGEKYGSKKNPFDYHHPKAHVAGWKGNPYHLPKGPSGGQFTHGPDSAEARRMKENIVERRKTKVRNARIDRFLDEGT